MGKKVTKILKEIVDGFVDYEPPVNKQQVNYGGSYPYPYQGDYWDNNSKNSATVVYVDEKKERELLKNDKYYPYYAPFVFPNNYRTQLTKTVTIFVFDIRITEEEFLRVAEKLLPKNLTSDYCFFFRNDTLLSATAILEVSKISETEEYISEIQKAFYSGDFPSQSLNIADLIKMIDEKSLNIELPNCITAKEFEIEKKNYLDRCLEVAIKEKESCLKMLDSGIHTPISRRYFTTFRLSRDYFIPKVKNICVVCNGKDMLYDITSSSISIAQSCIKSFKGRDINLTFYVLDKENVEVLAMLGADSIELEYENYS